MQEVNNTEKGQARRRGLRGLYTLLGAFLGLFLVGGSSAFAAADPSGIDPAATLFDPLKSEFVTVIVPAVAAILVAGIVWRMVKRNGKKAASDAG